MSMTRLIPAIVIHPCALFRDGLRQILVGTRFRPVHMAACLDEVSSKDLSSGEACVWLIGLDKCSTSTYDFVRRMHSTTPGVKTVILAQCQTAEDVLPALQAGASGFLSQDISCERLVKSLELIVLGETVVPAEFLEAIRNGATKPTEVQPPSREEHREQVRISNAEGRTNGSESSTVNNKRLSKRETAILRLLIEGGSNKVIARQLVITEATVKVHLKAILRKLRLHNRTQAAMWAHNHLGGGQDYNGAEPAFVSAIAGIEKPRDMD